MHDLEGPREGLHLGIDASNIRQGGGVTHLVQLLAAAQPDLSGVGRITLWCGKETAAAMPARPWLEVRSPAWADAPLPIRMLAQQLRLPGLIQAAGCDVMFSPGGTLPARLSMPTVAMSQNMLPFEPREARRFGRLHFMRFKMWLLRQSQGRSFKRASGVLFLTAYARRTVSAFLGGLSSRQVVVPHGIEQRFVQWPRPQWPVDRYSSRQPFKLLYVSILMPYKHQIHVAEAVAALRAEGLPVQIEFIGASWGEYGPAFRRCLDRLDPQGEHLIWHGAVPFGALAERYKSADAFVFASSCENLPNIMIEAMAAGLPIASSSKGPMPEVLGEPGCYFDPDSVPSIKQALRQLVTDHAWRQTLAEHASSRAAAYSWPRCARETLDFIAEVASKERAGA